VLAWSSISSSPGIFYLLLRRIISHSSHPGVSSVAQVCYQIDALIALANFGFLNPAYVFPEIDADAKPVFQAAGWGIPSFQTYTGSTTISRLTPGELAIITGSNMAGKSSFIKTVGVNLCLAYAGAPVSATRFRSAPFRLYSCVRISDSIVDAFPILRRSQMSEGLLEELNLMIACRSFT